MSTAKPPSRSRSVLPTGRRRSYLLVNVPAIAEEPRVLAGHKLVTRIRQFAAEPLDGVARAAAKEDDAGREVDRLLDVVRHEHDGLAELAPEPEQQILQPLSGHRVEA